ncbi:NADPH dehydrogenase [Frankia canadensis]|uniref:NADPH dehydrogenase n=1 Tax=Frankia canadensis TaxID=1836972 RepID=A0A2I2L2A8_9ACTN|nr:NADH:flavin oxidoreductase/NADH oxidase [Frankia canadensis]SNQ52060.1 NADPH dehydrogenase [Frankia canadensis]SOU59350.1 NADPH dehydrogenase [Frankia canadensis]
MSRTQGRLFDEFTLRGVTLRNRIVVSPMCQYSATDGLANDHHLVHLGRFAMGGFGLVMAEATAVADEGRLTYGDLGLWRDDQIGPLRRIADCVHDAGACFGIQLAHAGPKAATLPPWASEADRPAAGRWDIRSVTDAPYLDGWQRPVSLRSEELPAQLHLWGAAAERAHRAGADAIELHMAHGYLLHSFLSPLSNTRDDAYGGSLEGRMRFPLQVVEAVRAAWPDTRPLLVRVAAVDNGADGIGIGIEQTVEFARRLRQLGVDAVDCSSGGYGGAYTHVMGPGYQVAWASEVRARAGVPTVAVGLVTEPAQADAIVRDGHADLVALGRQALAEPSWPIRAREELGQYDAADRFDLLPLQSRSWLAKRQRQLDRLARDARPGGTR